MGGTGVSARARPVNGRHLSRRRAYAGGVLLPYTSWRGLFWTLTFIGIGSMADCLLLEETVCYRYAGTVIRSVRRLGNVLKNPGFFSLLIVFSLVSTASLAFNSTSSYTYEKGFGLSEQWYSV